MITKSTITFAHEVNMANFSTAAEWSPEKLLESGDSEKKKDRQTFLMNILENNERQIKKKNQSRAMGQLLKPFSFFGCKLINCVPRQDQHISCSFFETMYNKTIIRFVFSDDRIIKGSVSVVSRRSRSLTGEGKVRVRAWEPVCRAAGEGHSVMSWNCAPNWVSGKGMLGTRLVVGNCYQPKAPKVKSNPHR